MVIVPEDSPSCFLRLSTDGDGRLLQDVLPIGEILPLEGLPGPRAGGFPGDAREPEPGLRRGGGDADRAGPGGGGDRDRPVALPLPDRGEGEVRFQDREPEGEVGAGVVAKVAWYGRLQYLQETDNPPAAP